jgi:hypothetical protein
MPKRKRVPAGEREPGDFAFRKAMRRMTPLFIALCVFMFADGFAMAKGGWVAWAIIVPVFAVAAAIMRMTDRGRLSPDSWLQGARGERVVADLIGMLAPLGYRVIHGIEYTDANGYTHDIDHTVVGPTGVFTIETKAWNGKLWKDAEKLIHNGYDESGRIGQAVGQAKEVRRRLALGHSDVRWVEALLVSTKSSLPEAKLPFKYVTVLGASDLVPHIRDRAHVLQPQDVDRIWSLLAK